MKILKDRYTKTAAVGLLAIGLTIVLIGRDWKTASMLPLIFPLLMLFQTLRGSGRVHISESAIKSHSEGSLDVELKGEEGSFEAAKHLKTIISNLDGIKVNDRRYKIVDGADVVMTENGEIIPAGPGSAFMQWVGKGGHEPESIQEVPEWA